MFAICGGRGHGKDTFFKDLLEHKIPGKWIIYSSPDIFQDSWLFNSPGKYKRIALASYLKEVAWLNLTGQKLLDEASLEPLKEKKLSEIPEVLKEKIEDITFREYIIRYATEMREKDPDYWVKYLLRHYPADKMNQFNYGVTDLRYPNELAFLKRFFNVCTFRVFRSEIELIEHHSERSLDDLKTDYLVLTREEDFAIALRKFPQYQGFIRYYY